MKLSPATGGLGAMALPYPKVLLLAILVASFEPVEATSLRANPIRRIVSMLQGMERKITAEGKDEEGMFDKFMCYCDTNAGAISQKISDAETKIPQVESALKEAEGLKTQIGSDLASLKKGRSDSQEATAKATELRKQEAATFAADSGRTKTNIAALKEAIKDLEAGTAASFLQSRTVGTVQKLSVDDESLSSVDRDMLSSFLAQGDNDDARVIAPSSEIVGILKQMLETMENYLVDIESTEAKSITDYEALMAAKKKEVDANSEAIEAKLSREGHVGEEIVALKEDLDDTEKGLAQDKKYLDHLKQTCEKKKAAWETVKKTRASEQQALADTIKKLNDDDALDLFKKTLPSPSFLQLPENPSEMKEKALQTLESAAKNHRGHKDRRLSLIALTLRGGADFSKVLEKVDDMVKLLKKEQTDDNEKKAYCEIEFDKTEDDVKLLSQKNGDLEKAIADANGALSRLLEEISATTESIKTLDEQVAEATATRKLEHDKHVETMATDSAAKDILGEAKNRLKKFYQPKLYKAPPKEELSAAGRVTENFGYSLAQEGHTEGFESKYEPKREESTGVMQMLDMLQADLDKEMQTMTVDEKNAQSEYEEFMEDSSSTRNLDVKALSSKESAKASLEAELQESKEDQAAAMSELMAKDEELKDLHLECDWLLKNFGARKKARDGEIDTLLKTKAVLSGADYSFLQVASTRMRSLRGRHPSQ
jgi:hypothetical protein